MRKVRKKQTNRNGWSFSEPLAFPSSRLSNLRRRLLDWFDSNRRDLPWRKNRDPYRIWVSEVMLQQTQVATVIPYFERFLTAFPTLRHLADADEQQVLKLWEGLGYYRRARDLHRAARKLASEYDGALPDDPAVVAELPGIGRYILGAVMSQAFDRRLPIVEANSKRVLCRLFGQEGDPTTRPVSDWLWQAAEKLLPAKRPGDFNQALMELGALVCTPIAPRCSDCPVASLCTALRAGKQEAIPARSASAVIEDVHEVAIVIRRKARVLMVQRPSSGRWANMWEFPRVALQAKETIAEGGNRILSDILGIQADLGDELLKVRHTVTRFRITLVALEASFRSGTVRDTYYQDVRWLLPDELRELPVARPQRRLADEVAKPARQKSLF